MKRISHLAFGLEQLFLEQQNYQSYFGETINQQSDESNPQGLKPVSFHQHASAVALK
ncbi:MAG: hypothetical protein WBA23_21815 [Tunicatimonas sp.]|uniref:hypothetical protein n=1 Tax=Tunicatimonas sp. TaxID=1940096 RepID=UPI003C7593B6